ncbi:holliday junction ATP-dependent DNA helicase RuvB [Methanobrevibacter cuticularis]|uniref:Replication factor C large subunit n=1 Tax=Methanobrevibacter cuticularis TaxID=47311 RepID=A0A166CV26_9EURY|nr:replication factor C large subunit [Methanobrevibacter cuticularis]KZX17017.1 holliday junction ATP-dependent DNA helicase RuvB [Methanobrevibacter cuticularis]
MLWTEKYRPKTFKDMIGNGKQKKEIETWVKSWKDQKPQPCLLLIGPAGTGKTSVAHIIGNKFSDFIELNASDKRSYDIIMSTVGESSSTKSLFSDEHKLIILDEVDGIHGNEDRGGTRAINKIIKDTQHPIVMTANDFYSKRLTSVKPKCKVIKLNKVHTNSINALLKRIASKEGINADNEAIKTIAKNSNGDMRSALNTLQVLTDESKKLDMGDLDAISQKDNTNNIFDTVRRVLKSKSIDKIKKSMMMDEDPTMVMEYIAENIPREYEKKSEIKKAYEMISEADMYFGRARQSRNYTYWKYASDFMGIGVALSKEETYKKFTRLTGAMAFALMGRTRGKRALRDRIAEKMSTHLHVSNTIAISMFPLMEIMFQNDETAYEIATFLDLDDDEIKRFRKRKIPKTVIKKMEKEALDEKKKNKEEKQNIQSRKKTTKEEKQQTVQKQPKPEEKQQTVQKQPKPEEKQQVANEESETSPKQSKRARKEPQKKENQKADKEKESQDKKSSQKSLFNF